MREKSGTRIWPKHKHPPYQHHNAEQATCSSTFPRALHSSTHLQLVSSPSLGLHLMPELDEHFLSTEEQWKGKRGSSNHLSDPGLLHSQEWPCGLMDRKDWLKSLLSKIPSTSHCFPQDCGFTVLSPQFCFSGRNTHANHTPAQQLSGYGLRTLWHSKNYWGVQGAFLYVNHNLSTSPVLEIKTECAWVA